MDNQDMLTVKEAAKFLRCSERLPASIDTLRIGNSLQAKETVPRAQKKSPRLL